MNSPNQKKSSTGLLIGFWIPTALLAFQMTMSGYAQLKVPDVAVVFAHLGFPTYFRIELSIAKFLGVAALLIPMVPARIKEWAYAGFAITLVSAFIAHLAVGDGVEHWIWSVVVGLLLALSYFFYHRLQAR
jgi:DoxX-like family